MNNAVLAVLQAPFTTVDTPLTCGGTLLVMQPKVSSKVQPPAITNNVRTFAKTRLFVILGGFYRGDG